MNSLISAKEVYTYLAHELKLLKITQFGELEYSTNDDEDFEDVTNCVTWVYEPTGDDGLSASFYYDDNGFVRFEIGPVERYYVEFSSSDLKEQVLKTILMVLNGQLKLVATYSGSDGSMRYQAAELYVLGLETKPTVLYILSNHTRSAKSLTARLLSNSLKISSQIVTPSFWLLPEQVNGKYPKGRDIDFAALTPLSRSAYKKIDASLTIQGLGGEEDEPFWSYFYRTTEFWLVTIPFFIFDMWLIETFLKDSTVLNEIIKVCIHLATTVIVLFLTSLLLRRRQLKLDIERIPRFERLEDTITLLGLSRVLATVSVFTLLFAPMWTPANDYTNLFPGIQYIFMYPIILVGCLAMLAPLFFNITSLFLAKLLISSIYIGGIGLIFTANMLYMNSSETAPQPAIHWMVLGLFIPVLIAIWMLYKTFAQQNPRDKRERS